jgi:hypothetical protein
MSYSSGWNAPTALAARLKSHQIVRVIRSSSPQLLAHLVYLGEFQQPANV